MSVITTMSSISSRNLFNKHLHTAKMNRFEEPPFLHFKTRNVVTKNDDQLTLYGLPHGFLGLLRINTLSLLFFQRFLLVNNTALKESDLKESNGDFTMRKQIWKLFSKQL